LADNFVWTVDGMLVAIGVLEIGKQKLGNMRAKRRTEKQWGWRDGFVLATGEGRSDGLYPGRESRRGRGFRERFWTKRSDLWRWEIFNICVEFLSLSCACFSLVVQTSGGSKPR
jgi:hypothetical protein